MDCLTLQKILLLTGVEIRKSRFDKVTASCPFARWTHAGGSDSSPSFGFYQTARGNWRYKCFSCGERGSLRGFFWRLSKFERRVHARAMRLAYDVPDEEVPVSSLDYGIGGAHGTTSSRLPSGFSRGVDRETLRVEVPKLTEEEIAAYLGKPPPPVVLERGFSVECHEHFGLGHDEKNKRWVFPVRDVDGLLVGCTARTCWEEDWCFRCGSMLTGSECLKCHQSYVKYRHSPGAWRRSSVFGVDKVAPGSLVVICEGTTDVLRLWCAGVRSPVAILGASPSPGQVQLIGAVTKRVVCLGDGDVAGRAMNAELELAFIELGVSTLSVLLPEGEDPGSLEEDWVRAHLPSDAFCQ